MIYRLGLSLVINCNFVNSRNNLRTKTVSCGKTKLPYKPDIKFGMTNATC